MLFLDRSNARIDPSAITGGLTATDPDAIHVNVAAEISGIANKATPAAGDVLVIEDSASADAKKSIFVSALTAAATQDLWETIASDAGSTVANIPTDTLSIVGGTGISTAIAGDTLTITNTDLGSDATIQSAYDADPIVPQLLINGTPSPLTIDASVAGDIFAVRATGSDDRLRISDTEISFGQSARRLQRMEQLDATGRFGTELWPDDFTISTATGTQNMAFYTDAARTITLNIPGGGGLGDDTAPGGMSFNHTARFEDQGFLFASQLLINAAVQVECATATVGPLYLFLDQYNTFADGVTATCTQHNAMRAQPRWGPNTSAGNITQTSVELYFAACTVDATVGTAAITNCSHFVSKGLTLTAGGTVGEFKAFECEDIPAAGVTTSFGLWSDYSNADFFIRQTGTSISQFDGAIAMSNSVELRLGGAPADDVALSRPAADTMRWASAESLDWDFGTTDNVRVTSPSGASINIDTIEFALGPGVTADGTNNWVMAFAPGLRATQLAGDYSEVLFTSSTAITIAHAISNFATWTINAPTIVLGAGTITNAANVLIQTNMNQGTNRYGLLVTSSPSGGTLNYAARFTGSAGVRIDGLFEHTGSTFGIFGTTPATQPPAYTPTNVTTDRAYDANATSVNELADVLGTLIADLQSLGIVA